MITALIKFSEKGLLPDFLIRIGIQSLLKKRLKSLLNNEDLINLSNKKKFIKNMNSSPIALVPDLANAQHYEIPSEFYNLCLGSHKKYSSCFWDKTTKTLQDAESLSLEITCRHAKLKDGQKILELGCGWGSLSLWMASHYPKSKITSVVLIIFVNRLLCLCGFTK